MSIACLTERRTSTLTLTISSLSRDLRAKNQHTTYFVSQILPKELQSSTTVAQCSFSPGACFQLGVLRGHAGTISVSEASRLAGLAKTASLHNTGRANSSFSFALFLPSRRAAPLTTVAPSTVISNHAPHRRATAPQEWPPSIFLCHVSSTTPFAEKSISDFECEGDETRLTARL